MAMVSALRGAPLKDGVRQTSRGARGDRWRGTDERASHVCFQCQKIVPGGSGMYPRFWEKIGVCEP